MLTYRFGNKTQDISSFRHKWNACLKFFIRNFTVAQSAKKLASSLLHASIPMLACIKQWKGLSLHFLLLSGWPSWLDLWLTYGQRCPRYRCHEASTMCSSLVSLGCGAFIKLKLADAEI
ncbi:hypothetical protein M378DRAFT_540017 [Amanita muscaria Koide BX008]|uniref:Uncharacterized protein n=1 Tax=Amanita muscaria (strain Koide BX008) TaxID=946122 RepID=A0A0C2WHM7_AMAMK|nr:hypothetical protein M378DRAFT_540017 [Amanita muscaria Koide BX008]